MVVDGRFAVRIWSALALSPWQPGPRLRYSSLLMSSFPLPPSAIPAAIPSAVRLQVVLHSAYVPDSEDWLHEIKHDGQRSEMIPLFRGKRRIQRVFYRITIKRDGATISRSLCRRTTRIRL